MHQKPQRRLHAAVLLLFVALMIPGMTWAAARLSDPPQHENLASTSPVLLERSRPAEAEHENALKAVLARMLDRRVVVAHRHARQAAYARFLQGQISWRADWDAIALCESSQRWHLDVGIFDGGLQFHPMTWDSYGGRQFARFAWQATRLEQLVVATRVLAAEGPMAWPNCFRWD
jgi:hypothetical protein